MKYVLLFLGLIISSLLSAGSFIEQHQLFSGDSISIDGLGYPSWNPAIISKHSYYGYSKIESELPGKQKLKYYAPICIDVLDTVVVLCAKASQISCDTGYYVFIVTQGRPSQVYDSWISHLNCNDTLIVDNLNAFQIPEIEMPATNGEAKILYYPTDGAALQYIPKKNYEGPDYVKVKLRTGRAWIYIINVRCEKPSIVNELLDDKDVLYHYNNKLLTISSSSRINSIQLFMGDGKELNYKIVGESDNQKILSLSYQYYGIIFGIVRTDKGTRKCKVLIF